MQRLFHVSGVALLALAMAGSAAAQSSPYPTADVQKLYQDLLGKINAIPLYDNHDDRAARRQGETSEFGCVAHHFLQELRDQDRAGIQHKPEEEHESRRPGSNAN